MRSEELSPSGGGGFFVTIWEFGEVSSSRAVGFVGFCFCHLFGEFGEFGFGSLGSLISSLPVFQLGANFLTVSVLVGRVPLLKSTGGAIELTSGGVVSLFVTLSGVWLKF